MGNGGIEKYLQSIALLFKKDGHVIDYYYTNVAPLINHWWVHPDNNQERIHFLQKK